MIRICLIGHTFEFEIKNTIRIFDINSEIVKFNSLNLDSELNNGDLEIKSELLTRNGDFSCETKLYASNSAYFYNITCSSDIELEKIDNNKLLKTIVKKSLYKVLCELFNEKSDYGILTGIRPGKIITSAVKTGKTIEKISDILRNTYEMSDNKIELLQNVFDIQKKYVSDEINANNYNLYIHIPFCPTKCNYCSFVSYDKYDRFLIENYVEKLCLEINETILLALNKGLKLNTIYFGGGTPSVLTTEDINKIFAVIKKYYDLNDINEISFEAGRPDTLDLEKLICLKGNGVNRISINPQSTNNLTLEALGRKHTIKDVFDAYNLAKSVKFDIINMDLIIGLPREVEKDVINSIQMINELKPENITVHTLSYKRGSRLLNESEKLDKDTKFISDMCDFVSKECISNNYRPYYMYRQKNIKGNCENIGYALPEKESIYNIIMIEETETVLACGAGGVSKIMFENDRHERVPNFKGLKEYMNGIENLILKKYKYLSNFSCNL